MAVEAHNIIVVGSSLGGIQALSALVHDLPATLPASVFIVQHVAPDKPSFLPEILTKAGKLPAIHATEGPFLPGRIYVAPPDRHLLLGKGIVKISEGAKENFSRPAIDALFRSAADFYGSRVVGVLLTGLGIDGTAGLKAIRGNGGIGIAQDPSEAHSPEMPSNAIRAGVVDHHLPLAQIASLVVRLSAAD